MGMISYGGVSIRIIKDPYFLNQLVLNGMSLVGFVSKAHLDIACMVDPLRFAKKATNGLIRAALFMPFISMV